MKSLPFSSFYQEEEPSSASDIAAAKMEGEADGALRMAMDVMRRNLEGKGAARASAQKILSAGMLSASGLPVAPRK